MTPDTLEDQLTKYLTDIHSIEQQALAQMRAAPRVADGDAELAQAFSMHLHETEEHERLVRALLEARGATPAVLKDVVGTLTGKGFVAFAGLRRMRTDKRQQGPRRVGSGHGRRPRHPTAGERRPGGRHLAGRRPRAGRAAAAPRR
jgi:hypothetical protein